MKAERKKEWTEILKLKGNTVDVEQLWKELSDFDDLMDRHGFLVELTTGLSKITYTKEGLRAAYNDRMNQERESWEKDYLDDMESNS